MWGKPTLQLAGSGVCFLGADFFGALGLGIGMDSPRRIAIPLLAKDARNGAPLRMRLTTLTPRIDAGQGGSWIGGFVEFGVEGSCGIFLRSGLFRSEKLFGVQERARECGVVAGPGAVDGGFALELGAHGFHFGVE